MGVAKLNIPIGGRFGKLEVIGPEARRGDKRATTCRCACGTITIVPFSSLLRGDVKSCGCRTFEERSRARTKHGHTKDGKKSPEFNVWCGMLARCENPKSHKFHRYGARGITVCERWHKFEHFLSDMGPRPSMRHTLDRQDNDGNYEPGNCRWATMREQQLNRQNTVKVLRDGEVKCLAVLAAEAGLAHGVVRQRVTRLGWSVERALTEPVKRRAQSS